jgi:hypothetical protein
MGGFASSKDNRECVSASLQRAVREIQCKYVALSRIVYEQVSRTNTFKNENRNVLFSCTHFWKEAVCCEIGGKQREIKYGTGQAIVRCSSDGIQGQNVVTLGCR